MAENNAQTVKAVLLFLLGLLLVAGIGYIDFITGDYSLLIFYLIPVSLLSWYNGSPAGAVMAVASGAARFVSDASLYHDVYLHTWNSCQDMVFLLVVSLLVAFLRRELTGPDRNDRNA